VFLCFRLLDKIDVDTYVASYGVCILDVALIAATQTRRDADAVNTSWFAFGEAQAV
jgi:hypothetical protein